MIEINNSKYYNYNEIHQILSIPKSNSKTFCCFLKHYFYVDGFVRLTPTRLKGSISQSATSGKWNPYNANLRDREQIMFLSEKKMFIRGFVSIETEQIPKSAIIDPNIAENDVFPVFKVTFCDDCYINDELSTQNSSYFISSIDEFKETLFGYNENNEEITLTDYSSEKTIQMLTNMKSRFVSEEFLYFYRLEDIKKQCKASGKKK